MTSIFPSLFFPSTAQNYAIKSWPPKDNRWHKRVRGDGLDHSDVNMLSFKLAMPNEFRPISAILNPCFANSAAAAANPASFYLESLELLLLLFICGSQFRLLLHSHSPKTKMFVLNSIQNVGREGG